LVVFCLVALAPIFFSAAAKAEPLDPRDLLAEAVGHLQRGDYQQAAVRVRAAAGHFERTGEPLRQCQALLLLAETQQALGEFSDAARALNRCAAIAEAQQDPELQATVLANLGNVYIVLGPPRRAEELLRRAVKLAEAAHAPLLKASTLINLGNFHAFQGEYASALDAYAQGAELASAQDNAELTARAYANAARTSIPAGKQGDAKTLVERALKAVGRMPNSHDKSFLLTNLARTLVGLSKEDGKARAKPRGEAHSIFRQANDVAEQAHSQRASSYALGYLGALYEEEGRYGEALKLSQRAAFVARAAHDEQALYLWHWQEGRLLKAQGRRAPAIAAYQRAIETLQTLRYQMSLAYEAGSSFRESAGQVYIQLADLLLQDAAATSDPARVDIFLRNARDTVEQFKAAELRDYFQDQCVDALQAKLKGVEQVSSTAAVIYPIMLDDRLEILLSRPGGTIKRYPVAVGSARLTAEIHQFRQHLEKLATNEYRPHAQQLYEWLIKPLEADLAAYRLDTLVFVPDGALRTIPPAALFDGNQFLIEKYAVAATPGLELTDPHPLDRSRIKVLVGGLSKAVEDFPALEHVPEELTSVQRSFGAEMLLDENFQRGRLSEALQDSELNVLHIATHGQFSADARSSFLLAYDGRVMLDQLADYVGLFKFRDTPLELLVLSACETAQGDDRAALGLSGMAIKAGARSAVGALWKVNDIATAELIGQFYRHLKNPELSRAQALRRAQRVLLDDLRYQHPGYWSPFLLISGWL
jgi:CHAT domain-containing protein